MYFLTAQPSTMLETIIIIRPKMDQIKDFGGLLTTLQKKYQSQGAVKIIPPEEWKICINFKEKSTTFDKEFVTPKFQVSTKLSEGIYKLGNNDMLDKLLRKKPSKKPKQKPKQKPLKNKMLLEVKLKTNLFMLFCFWFQVPFF